MSAMNKDKFLSYVYPEPNTGCWLWAGRYNNKGYGMGHFVRGKIQLAHRYACFLFRADFDNYKWCLHHCDNPACVNPDHLYMGGPSENCIDRDVRGRQKTKRGIEHKCCKLTEDQVRSIRALYVPDVYPSRRLAREFGVSQRKILDITSGKSWKHLL
jgi:hypothetical protein